MPRAQRELSAFRLSVQDQILAKLEMIRELPEMEAPMVDAYQGYRSLVAVRRSYRIVSDDLVEIAYIRHCARQIGLRALRGARRHPS